MGIHTLRKLEHVLEAVNDLQAASTGELSHIPRVEESLIICSRPACSVTLDGDVAEISGSRSHAYDNPASAQEARESSAYYV